MNIISCRVYNLINVQNFNFKYGDFLQLLFKDLNILICIEIK